MTEATINTGLRTWRSRVARTAVYEAGGILLVAPVVALTTDHSIEKSTLFLILVSLTFLVWDYAYNLGFDLTERALGQGPSSARSHPWRIFHAISLELSSIIVTVPLIMWLVGLSFWEAVAVDLALSAVYATYAYVFHLCFDWLYPVKGAVSKVAQRAFI